MIQGLMMRYTDLSVLKKRMDELEAEVEAMDLGRNSSLSEQIDALEDDEKLDAELAALKAKMNKKAS